MASLAPAVRRIAWPDVRGAATRAALVGVVAATVGLSPPSPRADLATGLAADTRQSAFSILRWEVAALTRKASDAVQRRMAPLPTDPAAQVGLVRDHFANAAEIDRLRARRDALFAAGDRAALPAVERELEEREARFAGTRAAAEDVVASQVDAVMRDLGLRSSLVSLGPGWPIPFLRIEPAVFFAYQPLPLNLVVAPRDRIAIVGSVLVSPDLDTAQIEALEDRVDQLGVSSLVGGIGGLGSYPSMVPDTQPLRSGLATISHEWTHHYLALRPLGRAYFSSYEMRTINETVADIVGQEVGREVWARYYAPTEPAATPVARPSAGSQPAAPRADFGAEMRRIRGDVERMLAAGDVVGAEAYMAQQRDVLAGMGFRVRKLNTAYLSFFGAYAGGANRVESPLRALRRDAQSLAAFLHKVEQFSTPEDLRRAA